MKLLGVACKSILVTSPRLLHLTAYLQAIHGKRGKSCIMLKKCMRQATQMENILELDWATHSQQVWFHPEHVATAELWLTHVMSNDGFGAMDWHLANRVDGDLMKFSLPLPGWFQK